MALVKCPDCGKEHSDSAAACPNCARPVKPPPPPARRFDYDAALWPPAQSAPRMKRNFGWANAAWLALIIFALIVWIGSWSTASSTRVSGSAGPVGGTSAGPQLELSKWTWGPEYGYATAEGVVKNISGESLKNVEAVVSFYTKDGTFVKSDNALIEYNPILPGQTSPFKVISSDNPAMKTARVEFKHLFGGTIDYRETAR
jgi:hypothetical protein